MSNQRYISGTMIHEATGVRITTDELKDTYITRVTVATENGVFEVTIFSDKDLTPIIAEKH